MPIHQIIDVITVRHGFVSTISAMHMALVVSAARMLRCAHHRIARVHRQPMLIHVVAVRRMEVSVVQVIDMIVVHNCRMPAVLAVHVRVILVNFMVAHASTFILPAATGRKARGIL